MFLPPLVPSLVVLRVVVSTLLVLPLVVLPLVVLPSGDPASGGPDSRGPAFVDPILGKPDVPALGGHAFVDLPKVGRTSKCPASAGHDPWKILSGGPTLEFPPLVIIPWRSCF